MRSAPSLLDLIQNSQMIMISSEDASLKTEFLDQLTKESVAEKSQVLYVDFDLQFFSLLKLKMREEAQKYNAEHFFFYPLSQGEVSNQLIEVLSRTDFHRGGTVILDSINGLQLMLREENFEIPVIAVNRKTALFVTLFQKLARENSKSLVVSNISRTRPRKVNGDTTWEKAPVGGRMMKLKADRVLFLRRKKTGTKREGYILEVSVEEYGEKGVNASPQRLDYEFEPQTS